MIPVQRPYLGQEELEAVGRVFDSRWLGMGSTVKEFEEELKKFLGVKHVIAVNTGHRPCTWPWMRWVWDRVMR